MEQLLLYLSSGLWITLSLTLLGAVLLVAAFAVHRLRHLTLYSRHRGRAGENVYELDRVPRVLIQIAMYNEPSVALRAIRAAVLLEHPHERLEIQVLDDSTDSTAEIVHTECERLVRAGIPITCIRREHRDGFKAGALAHGLERSAADLVAIFDADFIPQPDLLRRTIGRFAEPSLAMLQLRWDFLNGSTNLVTRAAQTLLDAHFMIEHTVRAREGLFFNFNGTAGIWRASAIARAGGWSGDTLTEDLDLSYRAQLAGERFEYCPDIAVPSELPQSVSAFSAQQYRWTKGTVQTARKLLPRIVGAELPLRVRAEAAAHLVAPIIFPTFLLLLALLPLASYHSVNGSGQSAKLAAFAFGAAQAVLPLSLIPALLFLVRAAQDARGTPVVRGVVEALLTIGVSGALLLTCSCAGLSALVSKRTGTFERTEKSGAVDGKKAGHPPLRVRRSWLAAGELTIAAYLAALLTLGLTERALPFMPVSLLALAGHLHLGASRLGEALSAAGQCGRSETTAR